MTIADRRAALFQLRPSNILVAPLDAAGVDPGGDLVVYRAREGTEFLRRDALAVLLAEQDDLVPDLNPIVNPKDRSVHGNPSEEGPPLARDQGLGSTRERPPIPLRVPNRHRCRERRCLRLECQPVGYPGSRCEPAHPGDVALERHHRPQPLFCRIPSVPGRVQPVDRHAGPNAIVACPGMPEGGRRVRSVYQGSPETVRGEDALEDLDLTPCRSLVGIGGGEVSVDAGEPGAEYFTGLPHLGGLYAPAVHPRVHFEVRLDAGSGGYAPRAEDGVDRHGEAVLSGERYT